MSTPTPARRRRFSLRSILISSAATCLLGVAGYQTYHIHVEHRLGTVSEGRVYKSGAMAPEDMAAVAKRLGLRSVVDLRTYVPGQDSTNTTPRQNIDAEAKALAAVGVRHIHLPTPQVPSEETLQKFLAAMADPANLPTLIHCYHGIGRTELFAAVYHMEFEGWSNQRARSETRFLLAGSSFADTAEKGRYLIAYQPRTVQLLGSKLPPR